MYGKLKKLFNYFNEKDNENIAMHILGRYRDDNIGFFHLNNETIKCINKYPEFVLADISKLYISEEFFLGDMYRIAHVNNPIFIEQFCCHHQHIIKQEPLLSEALKCGNINFLNTVHKYNPSLLHDRLFNLSNPPGQQLYHPNSLYWIGLQSNILQNDVLIDFFINNMYKFCNNREIKNFYNIENNEHGLKEFISIFESLYKFPSFNQTQGLQIIEKLIILFDYKNKNNINLVEYQNLFLNIIDDISNHFNFDKNIIYSFLGKIDYKIDNSYYFESIYKLYRINEINNTSEVFDNKIQFLKVSYDLLNKKDFINLYFLAYNQLHIGNTENINENNVNLFNI